MPKSDIQKAMEQQKKQDRENRNRMYASSVVDAQPVVSGFRLMDSEAEKLLAEILNQYNGNENNHVGFRGENLPRSITENIGVQFEKLKLYGVLASVIPYGQGGGIMTISDTAKTYFSDKEAALKRAEEEKNKLNRLDEDIAMSRIHKKYDVFISHASKDKEEYVDLLTAKVKCLGIDVFYDTDVISWGDNWKQAILNGTDESEFAVIVISKNFFGREW